MNISEESEILTYAGDMAAHYARLFNMSDFIQIRAHYKAYIRNIARMVKAVDKHIDIKVHINTAADQGNLFNITEIYYTYDGEPFGIPWKV